MFARALFPTDFSAYANAVFACLPALKTIGLREVVLLNIIRKSEVPMPETDNRESLKRVRWSRSELLNIARMALEGQGLRVITRIEYGSSAAEIIRVADEELVDLIVMEAQGKTIGQELMVGSLAHEVMRRTKLPVLLQKSQTVRDLGRAECRRVCEQMFSRVLHPTDFSDCADAAFQLVKRLKAAGTEEVIVLYVRDERAMKQRSSEQIAELDRLDTERLEDLRRALRLYGIGARIVLRHGIPFRETLKVAEEEETFLIVLGSHGRSALREMISASNFENVVRLCRQPVLIVRCEDAGQQAR